MKLTALQRTLKNFGIAARRFRRLTLEEARILQRPSDYDIYQSELVFSPWLADGEFLELYSIVSPYTLVGNVRCHVLYTSFLQALHCKGEVWECGVYKGGTALMFKKLLELHSSSKLLRLFDSFEGMPQVNQALDVHRMGDFADTSLEVVRSVVGVDSVRYHAGFIPHTFSDLEVDAIAFAHIDLDLHDAITASIEYVYPRLSPGAVMVFDDYGFPSCPGAKIAVDRFFADKPEVPLVLPTAQALIHKL